MKSSPDNIIMALSHISNLSLSTGKVISDFKIAKIIPLYKKGDASDMNNYRPISLLSNISKILEKIMYHRVISFLNRHKFFFKNQFGFRKNVLLPKLFRFPLIASPIHSTKTKKALLFSWIYQKHLIQLALKYY